MIDSPPRALRYSLVIALVVVLAGCIGVAPVSDDPDPAAESDGLTPEPVLGQETGPDPETLVRNASRMIDSEAIEGIRTETVRKGGEIEREVTVAVAEKPSDRSRIETIRGSGDTETDDLTVIDGSVRWSYDREANELERVELDDEDWRWTSDTQQFGYVGTGDLAELDLVYRGTETVADTEAHVVEIVPPAELVVERSIDVLVGQTEYRIPLQTDESEAPYVVEERWWIDDETGYPIKQEITVRTPDGEPVSIATREYEEIVIGPDLDQELFDPQTSADSERFDLEPSDDATVTERETNTPDSFDTIEAADERVPFELPRFDGPDRFELSSVLVTDDEDSTTASVIFQSSPGDVSDGPDGGEPVEEREFESISVVVTDEGRSVSEDDILSEDVGEIDGTLHVDDHFGAALDWECESQSYRAIGSQDAELLIEFAETVGCPATDE